MNKLNIVVFFSGFIVMVFEMVGTRILGPYFGTSIFTWTNIIGVILFSLSLGYYYGGKIADLKPSEKKLSDILLWGSLSIFLVLTFKDLILYFLKFSINNIKISSLFASILLFAPTSIFFGMVSPYALKLRIKKVENAGSVAGNLSAISTIGSILGTFLAGFFLIPFLGVNELLIVMGVISLILALMLKKEKIITSLIIIIFIILLLNWYIWSVNKESKILDIDTPYNKVFIFNAKKESNGREIKIMGINNENHSAMYLDNSSELVNRYTDYYNLVKYFNPNFKKALMIGGAGYSFPKYFLKNYNKEKTIDVVEIDYKITELAKKYFNLKENNRMRIFHEDGRVFLNNTKNKYDVIFGDAFSSHYSIPFQLTTLEAVKKHYDVLNDDGVVILNLISSIKGEKSNFLRTEYKTYKKIFPQVYIFKMDNPKKEDEIQNLILIALKTDKKFDFKSSDKYLNKMLKGLYRGELNTSLPILTDNYAPVDYYVNHNFE